MTADPAATPSSGPSCTASPHPGDTDDVHARVAVSNSAALVDAEHESFVTLIRGLLGGGEDPERVQASTADDDAATTTDAAPTSDVPVRPARAPGGRLVGLVVVAFTGYTALAQLTFVLQPTAVTSFFPAAGLSLALLLLLPPRRWPLVVAAVFAAEGAIDLAHGAPLQMMPLLALANAVEPVIAAALIRRLSKDGVRLRTVADLSSWGLACVVSCAVAATIGTMAAAGDRALTAQWHIWLGWASGDLLGQLVVTTLICSFTRLTTPTAVSRSMLRRTAIAAPLVLAAVVTAAQVEPLTGPVIGIALLGWAALHCGMRWTVRLAAVVTATVVVGAAVGHDVLGSADASDGRAHILHQVFLLVAIGGAMLLAAEVAQRHDVESAWHGLYREARQARDESRVAARLLRGLVEHAPAAISLESVGGVPLLSNASHDRLPYLPPQDGVAPAAAVSRAVMREEARGERTYLAVDYPVTDTDGRTFALGSIHLDMTEQKQIMAELSAARAALQARADDLGARNLALQQLDELKTQFVATVSHELRTPLTSICGYTELLVEGALGALPAMASDALVVVERNSQRLLELIDTLLLLSTVDDGSFAPVRHAVDVGLLAERVVTSSRPSADAAGVTVVLTVPQALPELAADPGQIERMIAHLVSNAVKFSRPGGTARVEVCLAGGDLLIHVMDEGIGIDAEDLPQLFTRFHRAQSAYRNEVQGSGLGLAVSQDIAHGHGGTITVTSVPLQGSHFTVRLPLGVVDRVVRPRPADQAGRVAPRGQPAPKPVSAAPLPSPAAGRAR